MAAVLVAHSALAMAEEMAIVMVVPMGQEKMVLEKALS